MKVKQLTLGRNSDNDIVLQDEHVSRHQHCILFMQDDVYYITDNNSFNGVYVNGERISSSTALTADSQVKIGSKTYAGEVLIGWFKQKYSQPAPADKPASADIAATYAALEQRYRHNLQLIEQTLHIDTAPYQRVFPSAEDEQEYVINEYQTKLGEALQMMELISKASKRDRLTFLNDIEQAHADERIEMTDRFSRLQDYLLQEVEQAFERFNGHYQRLFAAHYETMAQQASEWADIRPNQPSALPYLLYAERKHRFRLFDNSIMVKEWMLVPLLKRGNLIIRYDQPNRQHAIDLTNNLLARLLASSQSGNIQLHTIDVKELGGTSNMLKMLDRHVYQVTSHPGEVSSQLARMDNYIEDVVQNLLYGPYTTLEQYNRGKEKQEPYHVMVIKDFPFGITPESAHLIQRIITNGTEAGVHFVFMLNSDMVDQNEECRKVAHILQANSPATLHAASIDLNSGNDMSTVTTEYCVCTDTMLNAVVQYVNAGFEMKKDEVLRLTDYMLPKAEWWTKHSANRADIPFGMSQNKQIQKLNITQESGQNSAIVIGIPGSGKSVFLHVLIANAMINYSPRELQMYLLDFSGVEFDVYARHGLPHARVIAPEAEREFGLSILQEVFEEGNRRMTLCRENGVTNIVELKQKNPDLVVPRLLVIIDEFQKIFEIENDKISKEANDKIHAIIQEYRKFGINLILATQKLPAKSIVPYDLIANRVVFKSDPNDFNNLIRWSRSMPEPRLLTGNCVYNNESGSELANSLCRSFFINASSELENLLDEVTAFAKNHPQTMDDHELRTFRSDDLPEFTNRILSDRHIEHQDAPREVGVYLGESIAISPCHVYMPLTKDSNNNVLIIGGRPDVAKGIAYHTLLSEVAGHNYQTCKVFMMNFMMEDDPMRSLFQSDMFAATADYCSLQEVSGADDVKDLLTFIKEEIIDARKQDASLPLSHIFLNIFEFQRGRMFDGTGGRGDMQSECARLLEYILRNGPMVGVFTVLQVDNLANLSRVGYGAQNMFYHRVALQMPEQESDKIVGTSAANKLLVLNRPATHYRGLYYNHTNNSITKFKPYRYES